MRIAMVFDGLGFGGIERVGVDYVNILRKDGYEIAVYNLNPSENAFEEQIDSSVSVYHYFFPRKICPSFYEAMVRKWEWGKYLYPFAYVFFSFFQMIRRKLKHMSQDDYDIVIAFSGHVNDLTFVANHYLDAKKTVCWLHGGIVDYALLSREYIKLYKQIGNIVTLSSVYEQNVLNLYPEMRSVRLKKIYNPICIGKKEIDYVFVEELKSKYGDFLLNVARFTKEKDPFTILHAVKILKEKYHLKKKIIFVGDGEERKKAEELAEKLGIADQSVFEGSRSDVQNYYQAATIMVHSSPAEGLPTVLLEALYFGLPIVATKSLPGVTEILGESKYGRVCEVEDAEDMARNIQLLYKDKALRKSYVQAGYERIACFSPECIREQLKEYLSKILNER